MLNTTWYGISSPTLLSNLVAYWTLNESSGNRADSVDGFALSPTGSPGGAAGFGNVGNVTTFNGTSQYLSVGNRIFDPTQRWSWAGWVKATSFSGGPSVISQCNPVNGKFQNFTILNNGNLEINLNGGSHAVAGSTVLQTGTWYHFALTYDGTTATSYINAVKEATDTAAVEPAPTELLLGALDTGIVGGFLPGSMVGWGVWNNVLSTIGISNLYNGGNGVAFSSLGSLVG